MKHLSYSPIYCRLQLVGLSRDLETSQTVTCISNVRTQRACNDSCTRTIKISHATTPAVKYIRGHVISTVRDKRTNHIHSICRRHIFQFCGSVHVRSHKKRNFTIKVRLCEEKFKMAMEGGGKIKPKRQHQDTRPYARRQVRFNDDKWIA